MSVSVVKVVAGVLFDSAGRFFLASRPEGKPYAGYWEFPGGKIEAGETPLAALQRELQEELGIQVQQCTPWIHKHFVYEHATVELSFFRVTAWTGTLQAKEGQSFAWHFPHEALSVSPVLPANGPVLRGLSLPPVYAITCAAEFGVVHSLAALQRGLQQRAVGMVQIREPQMSTAQLADFAAEIVARCRPAGCLVVLNGEPELAQAWGLDGVHLNRHRLMALPTRPELNWVGASVHNAAELAAATRLGCDYALLGPVQATQTHPNQRPLGWTGFAALSQQTRIPLYALGGLSPLELSVAQKYGARGVAMMRYGWSAW